MRKTPGCWNPDDDGLECGDCGGTIIQEVQGESETWFCPVCRRVYYAAYGYHPRKWHQKKL